VAVEGGEFCQDHDAVVGVDEDGAMAGPGGAEVGEDAEGAGERVTCDEGFGCGGVGLGSVGVGVGIGIGLGLGLGPEVEETVGGSNW